VYSLKKSPDKKKYNGILICSNIDQIRLPCGKLNLQCSRTTSTIQIPFIRSMYSILLEGLRSSTNNFSIKFIPSDVPSGSTLCRFRLCVYIKMRIAPHNIYEGQYSYIFWRHSNYISMFSFSLEGLRKTSFFSSYSCSAINVGFGSFS